MADLIHKTDYVSEGLARMLAQFKGRPRFEAFLSSWLLEVQALEDATWSVYAFRLLQDGIAFGDLLDKIGKLVGQAREGFSDVIYLRLILARIRTNRSDGRRQTLTAIAALLVPDARIEVREYAGAVFIVAYAPTVVPANVITFEFLFRAVLGGVRVTFEWIGTPLTDTLLFGYSANGGGGITQPTAAQSPGYSTGTPLGGAAGGAFTREGGST